MTDDVKIGDNIISNGYYCNIDKYFIQGPLKVVDVRPLPDYAGGSAAICMFGGIEVGFYINGVKKVK